MIPRVTLGAILATLAEWRATHADRVPPVPLVRLHPDDLFDILGEIGEGLSQDATVAHGIGWVADPNVTPGELVIDECA